MHHVEGIDRNQMSMMALEELVDQQAPVRIIDLFVDALDLDTLGFTHATHHHEGRPPYSPNTMLKLYMYGYQYGIRSSRKLEHASRVNFELIWLLEGRKPAHRSIARFRKDNAKAFRQAFKHFVLLLKQWELVDGSTIAIDSFKIRAQNAIKNNFNQKKLDRHLAYLDQKIETYIQQMDLEDRPDELEKLEEKMYRQVLQYEHYEQLEEDLKASGESQISTTDADARAVVMHRNIIHVGYNIQAACDEKYKLFLANDTGPVNDTHSLYPLAKQVKDLLEPETMDVLADKGYTTGEQLDLCQKDNIITYSSPKESSSQHNGLFPLEQFVYDTEKDQYNCPANQALTTNGSTYQKGNYKVKHYKTKACKSCHLRNQCTRNKNGRFVERSEHQAVIEANKARVEANPDYYRLRQQITEHQFGTLKRQWGFTFALMKGKEQVLGEVSLYMMIYNLRRSLSILGPNALKSRLKGLIYAILKYFSTQVLHLRAQNQYPAPFATANLINLIYF